MAELTRSGVCYDMRSSPYTYEWREWLFRFSSEVHRKNFAEKLFGHILWLNDSMSRRFHIRCELDRLAALQLYRRIETRGFSIRMWGDEVDSMSRVTVESFVSIGVGHGVQLEPVQAEQAEICGKGVQQGDHYEGAGTR